MSLESAIAKVRKLRSLASSTSAHEAAAAAAQADAIIQKYRLQEADLSGNASGIVEDAAPLDVTHGIIIPWRVTLAGVVAKHYGCAAYLYRDGPQKTTRIHLIGVPTDVDITRFMFAWLATEVGGLSASEPMHSRAQFCLGVVEGIRAALEASKKKAKAENTSAAMVLVGRDKAAEEWKKAHLRFKGAIRPIDLDEDDAFGRGLLAGEAVRVGGGPELQSGDGDEYSPFQPRYDGWPGEDEDDDCPEWLR